MSGPALFALPLSAAIPPGNRLSFRVLRNGDPIGTHGVAFSPDGDEVGVRIAIDFAVRILGIAVYRYSHRNAERWAGERLLSIDSTTDRDGKPYRVSARAQAEGIAVEGTESGRYVAPIDTSSTSYWHARFLRSQKIDTQGGKLLRTTIEELGEEAILIGGSRMPARRFRVSGELTLDVWYDASGVWSGLSFVASDGSAITYQRT